MDINQKATTMDRKVLLSTIWIFAALNYLYCDIISLMDSELLRQYLTGKVNGMEFNQGFLLGAAILVEIPIIMVLLSRVLKYRVNRWANIIAGAIMTLVQAASLFAGTPAMYYVFCSILEIAATVMIVWLAWNWRHAES
ncbi:MAG: hypothetical protein JNM55_18245 [Anaerolineales bacterium]|nr:hypothetical protein [Anaerolineales bacterium]